MRIVAIYPFNGGKEAVEQNYAQEFAEIQTILAQVDAINHKTKSSKEKTMRDKILYSPRSLNKAISDGFFKIGLGKETSPL
jgi:hypothetical protein